MGPLLMALSSIASLLPNLDAAFSQTGPRTGIQKRWPNLSTYSVSWHFASEAWLEGEDTNRRSLCQRTEGQNRVLKLIIQYHEESRLESPP
jgi:hypothetical protein